MKVLVTGGLGLVGRAVIADAPEGVSLVVATRQPVASVPAVGRSVELVKTDYSPASLRDLVCGCDAVIHLAARRSAGPADHACIANAERDYWLFLACHGEGVTNTVFASSRGVYGTQPIPWRETDAPAPGTPYALAKLQAEQSALFLNQRGMRIKCLRVAQVLALGEREGGLLSTFWGRAAAKQTLEVTVVGEIAREYIYVRDVASAIWAAVSTPEEAGVFNVGSGESCSFIELGKWMNAVWNNDGNLKIADDPIRIQEQVLMDSGLFCSRFDWQPAWRLRRALEDMQQSCV